MWHRVNRVGAKVETRTVARAMVCAVLVLVLLVATTSSARADDIHVPRDFPSLQEAARVVDAGDRIVMARRAPIFRVNAPHDPIQLPDDVTITGATIRQTTELRGDGLTLRKWTMYAIVRIRGDDALVERCRVVAKVFRSFVPAELDIIGQRASVTSSRASGRARPRVRIEGDDALFEANRGGWWARLVGHRAGARDNRLVDGAISIDGDDGLVEENRLNGREGRLKVTGDRNRVLNNRLGRTSSPIWITDAGITSWGSGPTISGNVVQRGLDGIVAYPFESSDAPPVVENNKVVVHDPLGHHYLQRRGLHVAANGPGARIAHNVVRCSERGGVLVRADGAIVTDNTVSVTVGRSRRHRLGTGLRVVGEDALVARNQVTLQPGAFNDTHGHGIEVIGDGLDVGHNTVRGARGHGLILFGSGLAEGNTVRNVSGHGIAVNKRDVTLRDLRVSQTGQDGVVVAASNVVIEGAEIQGARGVGLHVRISGRNARIERARVRKCREAGAVIAAEGVMLRASQLIENRRKDLITLTEPADLSGTTFDKRTSE